MTTYNVTFSPFNGTAGTSGTLNLTIDNTTATATISLNGLQPVTLTGAVASCSQAAQIINMGLNVKFPVLSLVQPSVPRLQVGLVGFYVSTIGALGGAGTIAGVSSSI